MIWLLAALAIAAPPADPRPPLAEALWHGEAEVALRLTHAARAADPAAAADLGIRFAEGHLLARQGETAAAIATFTLVRTETPALAPAVDLRLAALALDAGDAGGAASTLVDLLLAPEPLPRPLRREAEGLLRRAAQRPGGCGPVIRAPSNPPEGAARRAIALLAADCLRAAGRLPEAGARWQELLAVDSGDRIANEIVDRWVELEERGRALPALPDRLAGEAFARHRDFDRALPRLERALAAGDPSGELAWSLARARFWKGDYAAAAEALAGRNPPGLPAERQAEARHLEARARELAGDEEGARQAFRRAAAAAPRSSWAAAARFSLLRLEWDAGREREALATLAELERNHPPASTRARALLFLAAADLAAGRADRAAGWLERARATRWLAPVEISYWTGRQREAAGRWPEAAGAYAEAIWSAPLHPLALAAGERLRGAPRLTVAARRALSRAEARRAWALARGLGDEAESAHAARRLGASPPRDTPLRPVASWPLWRSPRRDAATLLLGLGFWREGANAAAAHFPARDPGLALTAIARLATAGANRQALALAEGVAAGRGLNEPLWEPALRRALAPNPYPEIVAAAAARHGIEAAFLLAIVREESRFDAEAFSPAGARGLAQFVLPTARRVAAGLGRPPLRAAELDRPEVALDLAAAHLADLARRYGGNLGAVAAAYNAGEAQADRWLAGLRGHDVPELLTRIGFRETRAYVARVLTSLQRYRESAPGPAPGPPPPRDWRGSPGT
ncbi:MAG: Soluble lytic murein transglycosylase precursor [Acidobacteria bacterium ADurb.Bin051]|jgi:soluble lytic murein transglycosylase|nr:MAG: Soluble lytic murein transglycosylase precursor [Acidobacteria bacterium ADurb.Bin051]